MMIYLKGLKTVSGSAGESVGGQIFVPDKICISAFPGGHMETAAKPTMYMDSLTRTQVKNKKITN